MKLIGRISLLMGRVQQSLFHRNSSAASQSHDVIPMQRMGTRRTKYPFDQIIRFAGLL